MGFCRQHRKGKFESVTFSMSPLTSTLTLPLTTFNITLNDFVYTSTIKLYMEFFFKKHVEHLDVSKL